MAYFGAFGSNEDLIELYFEKATKRDVHFIKQWIRFHNLNKPEELKNAAEFCNSLMWDFALENLMHIDGDIFKLVSKIDNQERIEGMLHFRINKMGETIIEGLEVAPWNRESYLGEEREFRLLGMILIGHAFIYSQHFYRGCGTIRLESFDVRTPYYQGLYMEQTSPGHFIYTKDQCNELIDHLVELGMRA